MRIVRTMLILAVATLLIALERTSIGGPTTTPSAPSSKIEKVTKTDAEWKKILTADQYYILREKGTEPPFHNAYWDNHNQGTYVCAACGLELFSSDTKFESGTGWPSFWDKYAADNVIVGKDSDGMRDE